MRHALWTCVRALWPCIRDESSFPWRPRARSRLQACGRGLARGAGLAAADEQPPTSPDEPPEPSVFEQLATIPTSGVTGICPVSMYYS